MYKNVVFYSHGHLGDVLISKYIIREIVKFLKPDKERERAG
jgi:hypothetical protein